MWSEGADFAVQGNQFGKIWNLGIRVHKKLGIQEKNWRSFCRCLLLLCSVFYLCLKLTMVRLVLFM